jgi:hypothetical protein
VLDLLTAALLTALGHLIVSLPCLQADELMKAAAHNEAEWLQQALVNAEGQATDLEAKLQAEQDAHKSQVTYMCH